VWCHQSPITLHGRWKVFQTISKEIHSGEHWQWWLFTVSASIIRWSDDNGRTITTKVKKNVVDNSWTVQICHFFKKTFKGNFSRKTIWWFLAFKPPFAYYLVGRYANCNEAIWRIFAFSILERHPTVVHWAVNLKNGQWVYFTATNVV